MSTVDDLSYLRRERELEAARVLGSGSEQLVTGPTKEPVTVDEAKRHLNVAVDDDNPLIDRYIRSARRSIENTCRLAFLTQTWDFAIDEAPCYSAPILLPRGPVASVTSVTSYDIANVGTVFSSTNYYQDTVSVPGRVALNSGIVWPAPSNGLRDTNAIIVRYVCGYTAPELVPDDLVLALLLMVGTFYAMRQHIGPDELFELPGAVDSLVSGYRLVRM